MGSTRVSNPGVKLEIERKEKTEITSEVQIQPRSFPLSGFTNPYNRSLAKQSHKGGYRLDKATEDFTMCP